MVRRRKSQRRRKRSGMHKKMSARLRPPTLVVPPEESLFGQPSLSISPRIPGRRNSRRSRRWTGLNRNRINPFSARNARNLYVSPNSGTEKPEMANKYIKKAIAKRNRTLRLMKYKRPRRRRRSRRRRSR